MVRMPRNIPRKRRGIRVPNWLFKRGAKLLLHPAVKPFAARALGTYNDFKRTEAIAARQRGTRESDKIRSQKYIQEYYRNAKRKEPQKVPRFPPLGPIQEESVMPKSYGGKISTPLPGTKRRKTAASYAVGASYAGRFKRMRKKRAISRPHYGNKDTLYGTMVGDHAIYSGYSTCGGRKHALTQFSEAFIRHLLKVRKVDLKGRDDQILWTDGTDFPRYELLNLHFRNQLGDGNIVETKKDLLLWKSNKYLSFNALTDDLVTLLSAELVDDNKFLFGFTLNSTDTGTPQEPVMQSRQVCDWRIKMKVVSSMKIQNITPADDAAGTKDDGVSYSKDSILSNPLSGRSYLFGPGFPRPRSSIIGPGTHSANLSMITNQENEDGLVQFPGHSSPTDNIYGPGGILHTPPLGGNVFSNCEKGAGIYLSPGNYKMFKNTFTFSGTIRQFCKKVSYKRSVSTDTDESSGKRFALGQSFCFGFSPTMRTSVSETIKLAYHLDRTSSCYMMARHRVVVPRSNTSKKVEVGTT